MRKYLNMALRHFGYEMQPIRRNVLSSKVTASQSPLLQSTQLLAGQPLKEPAAAGNPLAQYFSVHAAADLNKWFHYFDVYHRWFAPFREQKNLRVLEIGVSKGGSLSMWRGYFGQSATIVGVDINPDCQRHENPNAQIFVRIGSQADDVFLKAIMAEFGPFDIVIDDGSHASVHQIASLQTLYVHGLKDEGVYLVEDTHTSNWEVAKDSMPIESTFIHYAKQLIDRMHEPYDQYYDVRHFDLHNPMRAMSCSASYFCAHTKGIYFADSMVVFEKSARCLPVHETR